jgi:hypothetical protein
MGQVQGIDKEIGVTARELLNWPFQAFFLAP